ncbi:CDP-glycerol glycerophosphotransferase family protein [Alteromonas gilva]|uniref:CDP-glycerol glycerophosphotransferase family protein n=1 Tax=Alteromonas gilva TaxID=2987522 RepID=A0ABT5L0Y6_9ALTE|nr:CDP-glycerol glycerophosphotransferase family protein [Alteromonas gilva]MDC8829537.1 CDP-glycerol glycerophosphotransferase family protein [Alteromonas gilva]
MRYLFYISQNYSFEILRPIQQEAWQRGDECAWFVEGKGVNTALFNADERCLPTISDVVQYKPDAVFVPGNIVPSFVPGLKVQVFHGFEWKKKGHFRIRDCFDLYCTQGPFFTNKFNELQQQHRHFHVRETGWPKLDRLFSTTAENSQSCSTILYAPTFSPSFSSAEALADTILALSQQHDWQWIVKFHPKMDLAIQARYYDRQHTKLIVTDEQSIIPLLQQADVMVSDTSSVITEFLLLNKPVITFRNSQPEPPLLDITAPDQLGDAITRALSVDGELLDSIEEYGQQMHPYRDGQSAKRILDAVKTEIAHLPHSDLRAKPKNFIRQLKMRKRLGYWQF